VTFESLLDKKDPDSIASLNLAESCFVLSNGAVCGSSLVMAATMAIVGLPEMIRYRYADELAAGSVASGGGLGVIMPPGVVLIVYGVLSEESIGALFMAGIMPALLVPRLFVACIYIQCHRFSEQGLPGDKFPIAQRLRSLTGMGDTLAPVPPEKVI
jgi:TRAP-type C4-dicarboxylate transport system permease large subunit